MTTPAPAPAPVPTRRRWLRRGFGVAVGLVLLLGGLFALNGLLLAARETPVMRQFADADPAASGSGPGEVTLLAFNVAKGFAHRGGLSFDSRDRVEARMRTIAGLIRAERPDVVFLSEVLTELAPCNVDQVAFLARETGLRHAAFGEDYNVGLPLVRVVGGNAVLSRVPLTPVTNVNLEGRKPFWVTRNNRRALVVSADFGGGPVLLASLHNDSFDMRNNERQVRQLLALVGDRPAVLAGDFNQRPDEPSIRTVKESGRFSGAFDGEPTFFEGDRRERLDYIFAPADWEHVETRVVPTDVSDHRPVVSRFKVTR